MPDQCQEDGGFIGDSGCAHPKHQNSELVERMLAEGDPDMVSVQDADAALEEGFYVDTKNGRVGFGKALKAHLEAHPAKDSDGRKMRLRYAVCAVRDPDKVDENHRGLEGRTAYFKSYDTFGIMVVTSKDGAGVEDVFTFIPKRGLRKGLPPMQPPEGDR